MSATSRIGAFLQPVFRRCFAACALVACLGLSPANSRAEELITADQVRRLTPEQAEQHLEVRLKGVLTFYDAAPHELYQFDAINQSITLADI